MMTEAESTFLISASSEVEKAQSVDE